MPALHHLIPLILRGAPLCLIQVRIGDDDHQPFASDGKVVLGVACGIFDDRFLRIVEQLLLVTMRFSMDPQVPWTHNVRSPSQMISGDVGVDLGSYNMRRGCIDHNERHEMQT